MNRRQKAESRRQNVGHRLLSLCFLPTAFCLLLSTAFAQVGAYEGRPVASVEVMIEGTPPDASAQAEFKSMLKVVAGTEYSAANTRQSLHDLFASGRVAAARVEIDETQPGGGRLTPIRICGIRSRTATISASTIA